MIVVLVVLVLVGAAVVVVGLALRGDDGVAHLWLALVAAGAVGLLLLVAVGAGLGVGGGGDHGDEAGAEPQAAPRVTTERPGSPPLRQTTVFLTAPPADRLPPVPAALGDLEAGTTMVLSLHGLDAGERVTVHQCPAGAAVAAACRAGLPAITDDGGRATVLVDLEDTFEVSGVGPVRCAETGCSVVAFGSSRLELVTVFGGPAPPPVEVRADPTVLPPGATLTAPADRLPPGARVTFVVCRPDGSGGAECGPPTPPVVADDDGRASAVVTVGPGRCPRGATCAVGVVVGEGGPRAFESLLLIGRGGAAYDDDRLAIGIGVAALLLLVAVVLLRRTDWTPVEGDPFAGIVLPEDPFADDPEG